MNNNKLVGYLLIALGIILIIVIGYFAFFYEFGSPAVPETTTELEVTTGQEEVNTNTESGETVVTVEPIAPKEVGQAELEQMAVSFSERFGSYSTHSDYSNITDLKIFMTENMKAWADKFLEDADYSDVYYGITTKALSAKTDNFDSDTGEAMIIITTQRRESTGTMGNAKVFNQDLVLNFLQEDGVWKVENADWQE